MAAAVAAQRAVFSRYRRFHYIIIAHDTVCVYSLCVCVLYSPTTATAHTCFRPVEPEKRPPRLQTQRFSRGATRSRPRIFMCAKESAGVMGTLECEDTRVVAPPGCIPLIPSWLGGYGLCAYRAAGVSIRLSAPISFRRLFSVCLPPLRLSLRAHELYVHIYAMRS